LTTSAPLLAVINKYLIILLRYWRKCWLVFGFQQFPAFVDFKDLSDLVIDQYKNYLYLIFVIILFIGPSNIPQYKLKKWSQNHPSPTYNQINIFLQHQLGQDRPDIVGIIKWLLNTLCNRANYNVVTDNLFITDGTVRYHIRIINGKFHVHSKSAAVAKLMRETLN